MRRSRDALYHGAEGQSDTEQKDPARKADNFVLSLDRAGKVDLTASFPGDAVSEVPLKHVAPPTITEMLDVCKCSPGVRLPIPRPRPSCAVSPCLGPLSLDLTGPLLLSGPVFLLSLPSSYCSLLLSFFMRTIIFL